MRPPTPAGRSCSPAGEGRGTRCTPRRRRGESFARRILEREIIDHVLEATGPGGRGSDILMVGDRSPDIEGAAHFGLDTVAVTWGYGTEEEWAQARHIARTPEELEGIVNDRHSGDPA